MQGCGYRGMGRMLSNFDHMATRTNDSVIAGLLNATAATTNRFTATAAAAATVVTAAAAAPVTTTTATAPVPASVPASVPAAASAAAPAVATAIATVAAASTPPTTLIATSSKKNVRTDLQPLRNTVLVKQSMLAHSTISTIPILWLYLLCRLHL